MLQELQQTFPEVLFEEKNHGVRTVIHAYYGDKELIIPDYINGTVSKEIVLRDIANYFRI